jgi:signal transduction histidine kinase
MRLAQGALAKMRALLLELRPSALLERPLGELLHQLANALLGRTRMAITTTVLGERPLPADVQVALYRIAQEALNNVVKHADASQARVDLSCEPAQVTLWVSDNGRGSMRERASAIGAAFAIVSRPGQGTEGQVRWIDLFSTKSLMKLFRCMAF